MKYIVLWCCALAVCLAFVGISTYALVVCNTEAIMAACGPAMWWAVFGNLCVLVLIMAFTALRHIHSEVREFAWPAIAALMSSLACAALVGIGPPKADCSTVLAVGWRPLHSVGVCGAVVSFVYFAWIACCYAAKQLICWPV